MKILHILALVTMTLLGLCIALLFLNLYKIRAEIGWVDGEVFFVNLAYIWFLSLIIVMVGTWLEYNTKKKLFYGSEDEWREKREKTMWSVFGGRPFFWGFLMVLLTPVVAAKAVSRSIKTFRVYYARKE